MAHPPYPSRCVKVRNCSAASVRSIWVLFQKPERHGAYAGRVAEFVGILCRTPGCGQYAGQGHQILFLILTPGCRFNGLPADRKNRSPIPVWPAFCISVPRRRQTPSSRPSKPRCSVVVALTDTRSSPTPIAPAIAVRMASICGRNLGRCIRIVQSTFPISYPFFAQQRRNPSEQYFSSRCP